MKSGVCKLYLYVELAWMSRFHDEILAVHFAYFEVFYVNLSTELRNYNTYWKFK